MKRTILIAILLAPALLFAQASAENAPGNTSIGISKMVSHPALDAIEQGIQDYLGETGLPVSFDLQNCNGEISTAVAIAQKFKSDGKDLVIGIATPPAQALAQTFRSTPVVFGAITDPLGAGLLENYDRTEETNVCGVSDLNPVELQLKTFFSIVKPERIGMIYTSSEANGVAMMELAQTICDEYGVELVKAAVSNSSEVKMAAQSIIGRVDGMYIAIDNTVVSAIASVSEVCAKNGVPLFNTDTTSSVGTDFLMSWGFNYYTVGVETGKVVERIIGGEDPKEIGAIFFDDPDQFELWFNLDVAKKLGITIDESLLAKASVLVEDGEQHRVRN